MYIFTQLSLFVSIISLSSCLPSLPLTASGRWIKDSKNQIMTYAGVNWPGHMEAMIPDGLQYQSIESIVSKIKSLGMNVIRLTYAVEMVDDILDRRGDVTLKASLVRALGQGNGGEVWKRVVRNNPEIGDGTTRLQVFDAVAAECEKQGIIVHLDNHISRATWCCDSRDGNSWFGDRDFDTEKWKRGWRFMANYTKSWPTLASVGMRNELRNADDNPSLVRNNTWPTWYEHMGSCAKSIHAINPNLIVFFSGLGFDTDLSVVPTGRDMGLNKSFRKSDFLPGKIALELHNYQNAEQSCDKIRGGMKKGGWNALDEKDTQVKNVLPVVMTEFGFAMNRTAYNSVYAKCLKSFFEERRAGWTYWVLAGSYYLRQGKQDSDETWGMLNHEWSDWRSKEAVQNYFRPMVEGTLRPSGDSRVLQDQSEGVDL